MPSARRCAQAISQHSVARIAPFYEPDLRKPIVDSCTQSVVDLGLVMHTLMANLAGEKPLCQHERFAYVHAFGHLCPEGSRAQALSVSEMSLLWPYTR